MLLFSTSQRVYNKYTKVLEAFIFIHSTTKIIYKIALSLIVTLDISTLPVFYNLMSIFVDKYTCNDIFHTDNPHTHAHTSRCSALSFIISKSLVSL